MKYYSTIDVMEKDKEIIRGNSGMTIADRIKDLRKKKGWTQEDLAKLMEYNTKSTISKIETSGNDITLKTIKKLATVLGTSERYLIGWEENSGTIHEETASNIPKQEEKEDDEPQNSQNSSEVASNMPEQEKEEDINYENPQNSAEAENLTSYNIKEITEALAFYSDFKKSPPKTQASIRTLLLLSNT